MAAVATVGVTLLAWAGPAQAQSPGDSSAVDQYVEDIPTGSGKTHPGTAPPTKTTLPKPVQQQIETQGGSDAPLLVEVASSSTYGAPQSSLASAQKAGGRGKGKDSGGGPAPAGPNGEQEGDATAAPQTDVTSEGALSAALTAVEGGETGRLVVLLAVLLGISFTMLAAAAVRHRRRSV